jgi:hypothetical protein
MSFPFRVALPYPNDKFLLKILFHTVLNSENYDAKNNNNSYVHIDISFIINACFIKMIF